MSEAAFAKNSLSLPADSRVLASRHNRPFFDVDPVATMLFRPVQGMFRNAHCDIPNHNIRHLTQPVSQLI
jgi:hypothetical protein